MVNRGDELESSAPVEGMFATDTGLDSNLALNEYSNIANSSYAIVETDRNGHHNNNTSLADSRAPAPA